MSPLNPRFQLCCSSTMRPPDRRTNSVSRSRSGTATPRFRAALAVWLACFATLIGTACVRAAEYQWSAPIEATAPDPGRQPRAFLWIPPTCERVRAVVLGQHNMLEEGIFESSIFRRAMADLGFAIVWVSPSFDARFRFDQPGGERVEALMRRLAQESGYTEIAYAPIVPIGHSAHATYPWNFGAWNAERTLAILSIKGDAPQTNRTGYGGPNADWGDRRIDGVPGLMVMGEYEWLQDRLDPALAFRRKYPGTPLSLLADAGHGHFDAAAPLISYLALFLRKAAFYRLPADAPLDGPVQLRPVDPRQGWLVDQWRKGQPPQAAAAPYGDYQGDRGEAFWCFDEEIALATEGFCDQRGRLPQLLCFEQEGSVIEQIPETHQQVMLRFLPADDGLTFPLRGGFIDTVPEGNPAWWTGLPAGSLIDHAIAAGPVQVSRVAGPVARTAPDTWAVRFHRGSDVTNTAKAGEQLWFIATHEGDGRHKSAVQQAMMPVPMRNKEGADQRITFPEIPDQTNSMPILKLEATSDAGVPVSYYVREGPAEVEGDTLMFTAIPPRANYPIRVTVVAWQYGRSVEPRLKSSEPVVRTFRIVPGKSEAAPNT